jgi:hypothetical protein
MPASSVAPEPPAVSSPSASDDQNAPKPLPCGASASSHAFIDALVVALNGRLTLDEISSDGAVLTDVANVLASRKSSITKTVVCPVINVRVLPFPGAEFIVAAVSSFVYPSLLCPAALWVSFSIARGSEVGFNASVLFLCALFSAALFTVDLRMWRLACTAPNAIIVANCCVNMWAVLKATSANSLSPITTLSSVIIFSVAPLASLVVPLMDHDLLGTYVNMPAALIVYMTVLLKFYATGVFVGDFFGADVTFSIWRYTFSSYVLITSSLVQVVALGIRVIVFSRRSRAGDPQYVMGRSGVYCVQYREFKTDKVLEKPWAVIVLVAFHALGAITAFVLSLV